MTAADPLRCRTHVRLLGVAGAGRKCCLSAIGVAAKSRLKTAEKWGVLLFKSTFSPASFLGQLPVILLLDCWTAEGLTPLLRRVVLEDALLAVSLDNSTAKLASHSRRSTSRPESSSMGQWTPLRLTALPTAWWPKNA